MPLKPRSFAALLSLLAVTVIWGAPDSHAQDKPGNPALAENKPQQPETVRKNTGIFDGLANTALKAMESRAQELKVNGVAVVAYAEGDNVASWSSKMLVVGHMVTSPSQNDKGSNLLGIAYAKASEMAATLKDSGSGVRPPLTGEFGWQGGVVAKGKTGILIAAFSGGRSEDDVKISKAGLGVLASSL